MNFEAIFARFSSPTICCHSLVLAFYPLAHWLSAFFAALRFNGAIPMLSTPELWQELCECKRMRGILAAERNWRQFHALRFKSFEQFFFNAETQRTRRNAQSKMGIDFFAL
jgi:hypothetical protein